MKRILTLLFILNMFLFLVPLPVQASYKDNGNGTVTDTSTGLMWQKTTAPGTYTWEKALEYCEKDTTGNYTDWRLPTIKELRSLVDYSQYGPAINGTFFPDTKSSSYWSSTTSAGSTYNAWYVDFNYGYGNYSSKCYSLYVRAVRGGQSGSLGNLRVLIEPQGARDAGAQWKRSGTTAWRNSGYTESNLPVGNYTVEFKQISGWTRPANQSVNIQKGQTTTVTGTYGSNISTVAPPGWIAVPKISNTGNIKVSWGKSSTSGVTYVLEEATNSTFTSNSRTAYLGSGTTANITGRSSGKTYYYRVKAKKSGYNDSGWRTGSNGCVIKLTSIEVSKIYFPIFNSKRIGIKGTVYINGVPKPFIDIGGEDPVDQISSTNLMQTDGKGQFSYLSKKEPKSGLYQYRLYIEEAGEWINLSIPVKREDDSGNFITNDWIPIPGIKIEKGTGKYFLDETYLFSILAEGSVNRPIESNTIKILKSQGKYILTGIGYTLAEYSSNPFLVVGSLGTLTCIIPEPTITKAICVGSIKVVVGGITVSAAKGFSKAAIQKSDLSKASQQKWNERIDNAAVIYSFVDVSSAHNLLQVGSDLYTVSEVISAIDGNNTAIYEKQSSNDNGKNLEYLYMITKNSKGKMVLVGLLAPNSKAKPWIPLLLLE